MTFLCAISTLIYIVGAVVGLVVSGCHKHYPDGEDVIFGIFWPIWFVRFLWRGFWKEWNRPW